MDRRSLVWVLLAPMLAAQQTPVIVISIDTLRADHLSSYGYKKIRTPNIDSFAENGTVFTAAASQIPLTLPSHVSLFTSTYPFENHVEENAEPLPRPAITLAAILKSKGYQTAAFVSCVFLEKQMGLDQGFDDYDSPFQFEGFSPISGSMFFGGATPNPFSMRERRDGALTFGAAGRWLSAHRGQPAFVFLHLFDLHTPYKPLSPSARQRGISGYDAALEYTDRVLGNFKQELVRSGWWDRSLVILVSDHGEGLEEHGESVHGYFIYESTVWVPLMVHWPASAPTRTARDSRPTGLIDVAPTVLDFLHVPAPGSFAGTSLLGRGPRAVYSETLHTHDSFGWAPLRSLRIANFKYIEAPKPELYQLDADPHEQNNLVRKNPAKTQELRGELLKLLASRSSNQKAGTNPMTPETRAVLGSLGYLAGGPRAAARKAEPDPKDMLPVFRLYEKAQMALADGQPREAVNILKQVLEKDPLNVLAQRDLGAAELARGNYKEARESLGKVVAVAPDDYMAQFELGLANKGLGLMAEAREHIETACRLAPGATQCRKELEKLKAK